jgi:hypothetical protein
MTMTGSIQIILRSCDFDAICKAIDDDFHPAGYESSDDGYSHEAPNNNGKENVTTRNFEEKSGDTFLDVTESNWDDEQGQVDGTKEAYSTSDSEGEHKQDRLFCLVLSSNLWFMIGAIFYVWLAFLTLQYLERIQGIPDWVLQADDDYSWADYPIEDDYIFETRKGTWVSQSQIVYAIAATSFVIVGFIDLFAYPKHCGSNLHSCRNLRITQCLLSRNR